jgi:hypothetical protein
LAFKKIANFFGEKWQKIAEIIDQIIVPRQCPDQDTCNLRQLLSKDISDTVPRGLLL